MTKVAIVAKKPSSDRKAQVLVQIPRNRLGKLNKRWQTGTAACLAKTKGGLKSAKIAQKRLVDTDRDACPHVPILVLKLDRNQKCEEDPLTFSENEASGDSDRGDVEFGKTTHYKKQILRKHSRASRESLTSNSPNIIADSAAPRLVGSVNDEPQTYQTKSDPENIKSDNIQGNAANTSSIGASTNAISLSNQELGMSGEVKPKIVVLENTMIAAPSRHAPNSSVPDPSITKVTSPDQNKGSVGKHVLPNAMIPHQQYSRLAMPLNNGVTVRQTQPDQLNKEETKSVSYPNVVAEIETRKDLTISKVVNNPQQEHLRTADGSKHSMSTVRRKKSTPVRRRPTLAEEYENKAMQEQSQKLYTNHDGLELLSMVCTTTTASEPVDMNPQLHNMRVVNSAHQHRRSNALYETIPRPLSITEQHKDRFKMLPNTDSLREIKPSVVPPIFNKVISPQQAMEITRKHIENDSNQKYPPVNENLRLPYPNPHSEGVLPCHFNPQLINSPSQMQQPYDFQLLSSKPNPQNGKKVRDVTHQLEQAPNKQVQFHPPPPYYNQHQIISNPSVGGKTHTVNIHPNCLPPEVANTPIPQTNQHLPPMPLSRDAGMHPLLMQHLHRDYLNRIMPSTYDGNAPPTNAAPNVGLRHPQYQQLSHQQPPSIYTMPPQLQSSVNQKGPWQVQDSKNIPCWDHNNLRVDSNETCTLYYESQDSKGQTECTKQTIIYTEPSQSQNNPQPNAVVHQQENNNENNLPKDIANCPEMLTIADVLAAAENEKIISNLLRHYLPEQLVEMIIENLGGKFNLTNNKQNISGSDNHSRSTTITSPAQEQIGRNITSSVIKANPAITTPPIEKTFSHRIENFINPSPPKNFATAKLSTQNSTASVNLQEALYALSDNHENKVQPLSNDVTNCFVRSNQQGSLLNITPEKLKATLGVIVEARANLLKNKNVELRQTNSEGLWTKPVNEQAGQLSLENYATVSTDKGCMTLKDASEESNDVSPKYANKSIASDNCDKATESRTNVTSTLQEIKFCSNAGEKSSPGGDSKENEINPGNTDNVGGKVSSDSISTEEIDAVSSNKSRGLDITQNVSNSNENNMIKTEMPQHEMRDLNHNFPFDIQFGPNDSIESMFARIMPSCFMILTLIQEMQNVNPTNWWPVDTEGNLFKIRMSLRGISIFLRRSKKVAANLDTCFHHFFLFLLECLGTFRERVRKILETGHTLKENYISITEGDIYKDVFIQLYDYLCCTRVSNFSNLRTKQAIAVTPKKESVSSDDGDDVFSTDSEFSNLHQKHMVIIEKIKQRKIAEEQKNENYKKFISRLVRHSEDSAFQSREELNNEDVYVEDNTTSNIESAGNVERFKAITNDYKKFPTPIPIKVDLEEIRKPTAKRKIELIVIDSDSDEDTDSNAAKKKRDRGSFQPLETQKITGSRSNYTIANIINIDDDDCSENTIDDKISQENPCNRKRKYGNVEEETNKRVYNNENLGLNPKIVSNTHSSISSYSQSKTKNLEYEDADIKPQREVVDNSVENKFLLSETINKIVINEEFQTEGQFPTYTALTVDGIKEEIKRENEDASPDETHTRNGQAHGIIDSKDCSAHAKNVNEGNKLNDTASNNSPNISVANTTNSSQMENFETIEAIQNFLRETNAEDVIPHEAMRSDTIEESANIVHHQRSSSTSRAISTTPNVNAIGNPTIVACNENRLVGIATPNIKDVDTGNKKGIMNISEQNQTLNSSPNNEKANKIVLSATEAYSEKESKNILQETLERNKDENRTGTQKYLSLKTSLRNNPNDDNVSNNSMSEIKENRESVVNSSLKSTPVTPVDEKTISQVENSNRTSIIVTERSNPTTINIPVTVPLNRKDQKQLFSSQNTGSSQIESETNNTKSIFHKPQAPNKSIEQKIISTAASTSPILANQNNFDKSVRNSSDIIEKRPIVENHSKVPVQKCFKNPEIAVRYTSVPAPKQTGSSNFNHTPVIATSAELSRKEHIEQPKPSPENSKELLRQVVTQKRLIHNMRHLPVAPSSTPERHDNKTSPPATSIPSLQSIYNESVNTNGFISQTIKEEIGVLSKKESLGPGEYVQEISTLLRLPMIPKDFKDFYIFVTKQQILQFHQPIAFYIFLELLNQSGLKDYHKKFTEYIKKKYEDRINSKRREDIRRPGQFRHKT